MTSRRVLGDLCALLIVEFFSIRLKVFKLHVDSRSKDMRQFGSTVLKP
jgi:hypothetical protein